MIRPRSLLPLSVLITSALACGGKSSPAGPPPDKGGPGMAGMTGRGAGGTMGPTGMPGGKGTGGTVGPTGMAGMTGGKGAGGAVGAVGTVGSAGTMGGGKAGPPGQGGMTMPGKMGMGMGMGMGTGVIVVGIPTPGMPGTIFPGGGPAGSTPLAPGCTPASAHECPSASGVCATSGTAKPTGTTSGSICFYGPITSTTTTTQSTPAATIEYLHETAAGKEYYRFRITFDPAFVDNTYGANAIGWGQKGHTFKDLVGSDHAELSLFDGVLGLVSQFDIDYITESAGSMCAYGALGVSGGEGKMLVGDAQYVLASTTSLDRDLNGCGYCTSAACGGDCTSLSPATDASYTPNAGAVNWDYRVVYEVWMDAAVFAGRGFGGASISFVHASPSKASSNTVTVTPKPCGGCPPGSVVVMTGEGVICQPVCTNGGGKTGATGETGASSGNGETGATCPDGCRAGTRPVDSGEGIVCVTDCPDGTVPVSGSEGTSCMQICPDGSVPVVTGEGNTCPASI